jgi:E3 ubiquitin-protein ligase HUWE1
LTTSPRLPVFTRLQQSDATSPAYSAPSSVTTAAGAVNSSSGATSFATPPVTILSSAPQPQSQEVMDSRTSRLAEELARVVSQLVPASSSSAFSSASLQAPSSSAGRNSSSVGELAVGQSPSPSDMLAPLLMSSLQMPNSSSASPSQSSESILTVATTEMASVQPSAVMHAGNLDGIVQSSPLASDVMAAGSTPQVQATQVVQGAMSTSAPVQYVTVFSPAGAVEVPVRVTQDATPQPRRSPTTQATPHQSPPVGGAAAPTSQGGMQAMSNLDPAFLAALPDSIRLEVMAQHEREQRLLRAQREASFTSSISPEFLAALPPNIQEEVS